jgi:hypothetical protein
MKNSLNTILKYFSFAIPVFIIGMITGGYVIDNERKPSKHYPIEVKLHWETGQNGGYPTMDADSVKGDTIYKDGNSIVVKNIINIQFK